MWSFGGGFNGEVERDARGAVLEGRVVDWVRVLLRDQIQELNKRGPLVHVGRQGNPRAMGDARGYGLKAISWPHAALWDAMPPRGGRAWWSRRQSCGAPEQIPCRVWANRRN